MKYVVALGDERATVELAEGAATLHGTSVPAALERVPGTPVWIVRIGHEVHRVVVERRAGRGSYALWLDGFRYELEALDERTRAIRDMTAAAAGAAGPAPLVAPMPGLIVRVAVAPGDMVAAGDGLVVMEAMKMENELRASAAGTVRAVLVSPGAAVEKGAVLVELE